MEAAKPSLKFKYQQYDVELKVATERKLSLSVIDSLERVQYHQNECVLQLIGTNTLFKAFQQTKPEIKVHFGKMKIEENNILSVKISVESAFLKPVIEEILLKQIRDVSEGQIVKNALDGISRKMNSMKNSSDSINPRTFCNSSLKQKNFNGASYDPMTTLQLPKGNYLLTCNFLLDIYLYLNQGQNLMQHSGCYVPSNNQFITCTVRKRYDVEQQNKSVSFTVYGSGYPVTIRNAIMTAKPIAE